MLTEKTAYPNFFIIGAPKSGTTALSEYLRQHPEVLFSNPKEPHFFNDDFSHRHITSLDKYLSCFAHATGEERALGEGSVFYLYSKTAVSNIVGQSPHAKFIVMLRNPIEAVYSWHWEVLFNHGENLNDFEEAWHAQEKRKQGKSLPPHNRVREALRYGPLFSYGEQLERLFKNASKENILIILYDDFRNNPGVEYQRALDFLDLSPLKLASYNRINPSKRLRFPIIETASQIAGSIKRKAGIKRGLGVLSAIKKANTKYEDRPRLRESFKKHLHCYFRKDIKLTEELIRKDLSDWLDR